MKLKEMLELATGTNFEVFTINDWKMCFNSWDWTIQEIISCGFLDLLDCEVSYIGVVHNPPKQLEVLQIYVDD